MKRLPSFSPWFAIALAAIFASAAQAQSRPYIGYAYPAGAQIGTTVEVRLGGQAMEDVTSVIVSGTGVTAQVVDYRRRLNNQEIQLLNEQLRELKRAPAAAPAQSAPVTADQAASMATMAVLAAPSLSTVPVSANSLQDRIERRVREWVQTPACASIASLVIVAVTVSPEAEIGTRELRLVTARGVSNPLVFQVGQLAEYSRKPMNTALLQILGKEASALRKRPPAEGEVGISLPCTVNGQIASGEVNRYRFSASKGQKLVISTQGRQLIPYIADAVPGWFQPVLALYDAKGKELAFADDYRFKPDPVILFQVPADGDYVFAIYDSIYRGREDFIYRITVGELPFATSVFPLGGQIGAALPPDLSGWNLRPEDLATRLTGAKPGVQTLAASRMGYDSNRLPFAWDTLPDAFDREPNNSVAGAQTVTLPVVINGRIQQTDDWDVYSFTGKANQTLVAEVQARRLDSPLDSVIKLTDAAGKVIAFNDDREDLTAGVNTHPADSWFTAKLPADGTYFVHLGETARKGGDEYGYRLRLSAPRPDFELRLSPSSVSLPINSTASVSVHVVRKEGFTGPIKLALAQSVAGFTAVPITIPANQTTARLTLKSGATPTQKSLALAVIGTAKINEREIVREAVATEDRMQAFLWRHLVPANDLQVVSYDPRAKSAPKRIAPTISPLPAVAPVAAADTTTPAKPKFTKQQIVGRLRQLKLLYEEGLLTDSFYAERVAECETPS
jgi:hypothetical protein